MARFGQKPPTFKIRPNVRGTEISFPYQRDFEKFVKHLSVLNAVQLYRPESIYALAAKIGKDVANATKIVRYYRDRGVVRTESRVLRGGRVQTPTVEFSEFVIQLETSEPRLRRNAFIAISRRR